MTIDRIIAIGSAALAALALAMNVSSKQAPVESLSAVDDFHEGQSGTAAASPGSTQADTARLIILEMQVRDIMAKLEKIQISTAPSKIDEGSDERSASSHGGASGVAPVAVVDSRLEEIVRAGSTTPFLELAREQFATEDVDTRWSASAEKEVASFLSGRDVDVESIVCKSSFCRSDILLRDNSVFEALMTEFSGALPWSSAAWFHQDQFANGLHFELYFAREKDTL